jgi:anti-sigma B factor antagonist
MSMTVSGDAAPPDGALFGVDTQLAGRGARLTLRGELDLATVGIFDAAVRAVRSCALERIEIDLGGLTFIGSAGVAALLAVNARARDVGCVLTLVRGPEPVHRIFELTGIDRQFAFRPPPGPCARGALRIAS